MATDNKKTDFLRFSAYSIKELITRKLSQDSRFTDQVYEGSNLAVLIDIFSYIYQCLVYQLNNAAAESMFQDTQLFENMVRLVKFLDYNPKGCSPASMNIKLDIDATDSSKILPFAYIDTGLVDDKGQKICFSNGAESINFQQSTSVKAQLYNGIWKMCPMVFTASGTPYETFNLGSLKSSNEDGYNVANDFIYVYVYDEQKNTYTKWDMDRNGIFITSKQFTQTGSEKYFSLYGNEGTQNNVYSLTLNQYHEYEIRFGDGNIGNLLKSGNKIYVFYLDTNGYNGEVDTNTLDVTDLKFQTPPDIHNTSESFRQALYDTDSSPNELEKSQTALGDSYSISYDTDSSILVTQFTPEESVQDIKNNAPNWFKTGYRLITRKDYEYFLKNNKDIQRDLKVGNIIDVKCMNNIELVSKFYKWLYIQGMNRKQPNGRYYLDNSFFTRSGYSYVDPADANNIYLWLKTTTPLTKEMVKTCSQLLNGQMLQDIKIMTAEIQVMNPITVNFDICAAPTEYAKEEYMEDNLDSVFDPYGESVIEVTLDDKQTYIGNNIQQQVYDIILQAFNQNYIGLGQSIDSVQIVNKIFQINGVERVRTVWTQNNSDYVKALDGISFASWSDAAVLDEYEDFTVGNSIRHIEEFQFPQFVGETTLFNRIRVIKKQLTTVNSIKF